MSKSAGLLLLLAGLFVCTTVPALDRDRPISTFHHTKWTAKDGAPPDVWALAQTPDGWLWLGGPTGLHRFDGIRFERVPLSAGDATRSQSISVLFVADNGDLWVGFAFGGATRISDGQQTHFGPAEGLAHGTVITIEESSDGALWAPCANGFLRFDGTRWETVGAQWSYPDPHAWNVYRDGRDRLWVAGEKELFYLDAGGKAFQRSGLSFDEAPAFTQTPDGRMWYVNSHGLALLPDQDGVPPRARNHTQRTSYVSLFDRDGVLWTVSSAAQGLRRIPNPRPGPMPAEADSYAGRNSPTPNVTKTLLEDREGNLWLTTIDSVERFRHTNVMRPPALSLAGQLAVAPADDGAIWIGAYEGMVANTLEGLWKFDGELQRLQPQLLGSLTALHRDPRGQLWIGGTNGIWRTDGKRFEPLPMLPEGARGQPIHQISIDSAGDLWAGVVRSHLFRFNNEAWQVLGGRDDLPDKRPLVQATGDDGSMWFAYDDGTVLVLSERGSRRFGAAEGLKVGIPTALRPGTPTLVAGEAGMVILSGERFVPLRFAADPVALEGVTGLLLRRDGALWLNGMRGAVRIPPGQLDRAITGDALDITGDVFDAEDGYPGIAQRIRPLPTLTQGSDGRLWFVGLTRIGMIDPARIRLNEVAPPLALRSIVADGRSIAAAATVSLTAGTRNLSIAYTSLSLSQPERVRFRYRLEGFDDSWIDAGTRREAFYTNLAPGQYRFRVAAANEHGVWNENGIDLPIELPPSFVQTVLFKVLCTLAAAFLLWFVYAIRIQQVRRSEHARLQARLSERERIARELHDTLLQGMQGMILRFARFAKQVPAADPMRPQLDRALDRAESLLSDGRDRVQDLRINDNGQPDLAEMLRDAGRELATECGIQFDLTVSETPRPLHPMVRYECERIALEALTNACKHSGAKQIGAALRYGHREFTLQISDDGIGIDEQIIAVGKQGHFGLLGMRERAGRINADLFIQNAAGTTIALAVPARVAYA